jgi:hypothetical protein
MTGLAGLDSYQQPTQAQAQALWAQGYRWWAFNIGGPGAADVWAVSTVTMLRNLGYKLLPIWVPALDMSGDPVADAMAARAAVARYGLTGTEDDVIAVDTERQSAGRPLLRWYMDTFTQNMLAAGWQEDCYRGAEYVPAGAHQWDPSWVSSPENVAGDTGAQQWAGNVSAAGMAVDLDLAGPDFPLDGTTPAPPPPPTPKPGPAPVVVQTVTDKELGTMRTVLVEVSLDPLGNGQLETPYPASSFIAVSHQCADADVTADDNYWYGEVGWQPRNNNILVAVTRAANRSGTPTTAGVYLTLAE